MGNLWEDLLEVEPKERDNQKTIESFNEMLKTIESLRLSFSNIRPQKQEISKEQALIKKMAENSYFENLFLKKEIKKNEFRSNRRRNRSSSR